jgi:membrane glycosyltransferase
MTTPNSPVDRQIRTPQSRIRRWFFATAVLSTTATGTLMMLDIVRAAGITALEIVILALFAMSFGWITTAFWNATIGFTLQILRRDPLSLQRIVHVASDESELVTRTALIMPAHNEDSDRLVNGLSAMIRSLEGTGQARHFSVHLLSDTTDPTKARAEEAAWGAMRGASSRPDALHYRRRPNNSGRKAGNIADFCKQWGDRYDFMVVLDADSLMSGTTLVELVRTMEANPRAGLLQTVPIPAHQETAFGRILQFAAELYSPMLAWGQCFWQTDSANYWGHNAIVRVRPFIDHCRLPILPGRPPLGGPVLSHDFVEAALLRRAGWLVYLLPTLGGSYEEVPSNLFDFAKRDRRWAQGSLQHLKLIREPGLTGMNRLHFLLGAMGYLSSVLWLLILLASTSYILLPALSARPILEFNPGWLNTGVLLPLLAFTAVILFVPKVLGVVLALSQRKADLGGGLSIVASASLEALFAVLVAPVMMIYHTGFVASILRGRDVEWETQPRDGRTVAWSEAWNRTVGLTGLGLVWSALTLFLSPAFFLWLTPIFAGLLLACPLARGSSSFTIGGWLRTKGLLLVETESHHPREIGGVSERGLLGMPILPSSKPHIMQLGRMYEAERGLFEIRRGRPLYLIPDRDQKFLNACLFAAVEGLDVATLDTLRRLGSGPMRLIVTAHRAGTMGLDGAAAERGKAWGISLSLNGETPEEVFHLSSALGPFDVDHLDARDATNSEAAGLSLTRMGKLIPAVVSVPADPQRVPELREALDCGAILKVRSSQLFDLTDAPQPPVEVTYVSDAPVPLAEAEDVRFMLFREANGLREHVAVLVGDRKNWEDPVPVRLHSACLTGDLFGSLRCDCGDQLRGSLRVFAASGGGVLLYLEQEGRGIGLGNKLRAYALQQEGLDTVDADCVLGFGSDERNYDAAVAILRVLEIERVRLLTNNPEKLKALEAGGIRVMDRQALHGTLNRHNLPYVTAKIERAGHWLGEMLEGPTPRK